MINVPGYDVKEKLYYRKWYTIYRAISEKTGLNVLLKVLNKDFKENIFNTEKEFKIMKNLTHVEEVAYCYELIKNDEVDLIVFEDINGFSIREYLDMYNDLNIRDILSLSIRIMKGINNIHRNGIIHKNINDNCIIYNHENSAFRITDFKLATFSKRYYSKSVNDKLEKIDLKFISPEQCSMRNRLVDYRTDYYSFGVLLYKMLTGFYPIDEFETKKILYNLLNVKPKELVEINKKIPQFLNNLVMKLLEKEEDKRYQSGIGIIKDLELTLNLIDNNAPLNNISLAKYDYLQNFNFFNILYGNEKKINKINNILKGSFEGNKAVIFINGYFITDKLELISESFDFIKKNKGNYVVGEFENKRFKKPFSAIVDVFNALAKIIKKNDQYNFEDNLWRIANNEKIIADLFSEFDDLITKKSALQVFFIEENQNRFIYVMQEFIKICATKKNPLVLVLKNIHNADKSSIELLSKIFMDSEIRYFTIITTYENENLIDRDILKDLRKIQSLECYNEVFLQKFEKKELDNLLKHFFSFDDKVLRIICDKIIKFSNYDNSKFLKVIKIFIKKRIIYYDEFWEYNSTKLKNDFDYDNITEYLKYNISKLSEETLEVLYKFSAVESYVSFELIESILGMTHRESYKYIVNLIDLDIIQVGNKCYEFSDEGIKEHIYKSIKDEKIKNIHYNIIENFLKRDIDDDNGFFSRLFHYYEVKDIIKEKYKLSGCESFIKAGFIYKKAVSYYESYKAFKVAKKFLPENSWEFQYDLFYQVMYNIIETSFASKKFNECEKFCDYLDNKIIGSNVEFYSIYVKVCYELKRYNKMSNIVQFIFRENGIKIPKKINYLHLIKEKYKFNFWIRKLKKEDKIFKIVEMPFNSDSQKIEFMNFSEIISDIFYIVDIKEYIYIYIERFKYILKNGNFKESIMLLIIGSYFIYELQNNLDLSFKISKISFSLLDKYDVKVYNLKARGIYNTTLRFNIEPLKNSIEPLKYIFESAFEYGDFNQSSFSAFSAINLSIYSGVNFKNILMDTIKYIKLLSRFGEEFDLSFFKEFKNIISYVINLDKDSNYENSKKDIFSDLKFEMKFFETNNIKANMLNIFKLYIIYLLDDENDILKKIKTESKILDNIKVDYIIYHYYFFEALIYLKIYKNKDKKMKKTIRNKVKKITENLEYSANYCEYNFLHKYYLLKAEFERYNNNYILAKNYYKEAIEKVIKTDFTNEEALCYELAAKFYFEYNNEVLGSVYIKRAYSCYKKLGIILKTEKMKKKYARYFKKSIVKTNIEQFSLSKSNSLVRNNDLEYVLKMSQEISGELDEINFIRKILSKSMELIKSSKIIFVVYEESKFKILSILNENSRVNFYDDLYIVGENSYLAYKVLEICYSSKKKVKVNDAYNNGMYNGDIYIKENLVKSILCLPVKDKNSIRALLYFENNIAKNAYNMVNYNKIEVFLNQINISYKNVVFYEKYKSNGVFLENRMKNKRREIMLATKNYEDTYSNFENIKNTDVLTGILSREEFVKKYNEMLRVFSDKKNSIVVIKIENLNDINCKFGFQKGDSVLIKISQILYKNFRDFDIISRWSGNEFVLVVYDIGRVYIKNILERVKLKLFDIYSEEYNKKIDINIIYIIKDNINNNDIEYCIIDSIRELSDIK